MIAEPNKVKVVVFCCSGRFQSYFLHRTREQQELLGVVFCDPGRDQLSAWQRAQHLLDYARPMKFLRYLISRLVLPYYESKAEACLRRNYPQLAARQKPPAGLKSISVGDINDPRVAEFVGQLNPQLICVNGTNLIREPLLSIAAAVQYGTINLHTGLSPYARGGNCNLFMLLENQPQLVGSTVHYIDHGIDSGDIIQTLRPEIQPSDPYEYIEAKVFISGFDALLASIPKIEAGVAPRVAQWQKGSLFLERTGYRYEPYHRALANWKISRGLLRRYLDSKAAMDSNIRLVG